MRGRNRKILWVVALIVAFTMCFGSLDAAFAAGGGGGGTPTLDVNATSIISGEGTLETPIAYAGGSVSFNIVTGGLVNRWSDMEADVKSAIDQIAVQTESGESAGTAVFGEYCKAEMNKEDPNQPYYTINVAAASGDFALGEYKIVFPEGYPVKGNPTATDRKTTTECTLHFTLARDITSLKATAAKAVYNGKAQKPAVRIAGLDAANYAVTYPNAVKSGTYKATVRGAAQYYIGTVTVSFSILPAKAKLKFVKPGKKKITVRPVNQKASGITGYQIFYKKSGTKKWKKTTLAAGKTSKTIKKLKKGKKYSVRIRGYKKTGGGTLYGAYSPVKTVKVK